MTEPLIDPARLRRQLVYHEGNTAKPYVDSTGHVTVGIGHNLSAHPVATDIRDRWYQEDVAEACATLLAACPWVVTLNEVRRRVLVDMTFNMGIETLLTFEPTLAHIQAGEYAEAVRHLRRSLWSHQVGDRSERLMKMLETGEDPPEFA